MTSELYPGESDLHELAAAHARLAGHGVLAGDDGYDLATLAAAAYREGWSYRIDRAVGMLGYEAEVQMRDGVTRHRGLGWDSSVALAFALSSALAARSVFPPDPRT